MTNNKMNDASAKLTKKLLKQKKAILIHTMAKVGTTTLVKTLYSLNLKLPIIHTHTLNEENLQYSIQPQKDIFGQLPDHLQTSLCIQPVIYQKSINWKVITLIRDPIARNISAFFYNIDKQWFPNFYERYANQELPNQEIINKFLREFHHQVPLTWVEKEICSVFNINVYGFDFPKEKGYQIYHNDNIDLLVLKLENLEACYQQAFKEFLGIDIVQLEKANTSEDKKYKDIYKNLNKSLSLPPEYLDQMYISNHVRHFYTEAEIELFKQRWS